MKEYASHDIESAIIALEPAGRTGQLYPEKRIPNVISGPDWPGIWPHMLSRADMPRVSRVVRRAFLAALARASLLSRSSGEASSTGLKR